MSARISGTRAGFVDSFVLGGTKVKSLQLCPAALMLKLNLSLTDLGLISFLVLCLYCDRDFLSLIPQCLLLVF